MRAQDVLSFCASLVLLSSTPAAHAAVTLYNTPGQAALGTGTATATQPQESYTGLGAYDPLVLAAPPIPNPPPATAFGIELVPGQPGMSIPLMGNVLGFSIEMSVMEPIIGRNSSYLNVPFLNLMSNLVARGGKVQIRIGGNTQETATLVQSLEDGRSIEKDHSRVYGTTETPPIVYTPEMIYMLANVSALLDVEWFLGVPLNDTSNLRLDIAEHGFNILGDKLKGLQVGNEPDLYYRHGHRPSTYDPQAYSDEFRMVADALNANPNIQMRNILIGPSIASAEANWQPQDVWNTGFITAHPELGIVSVERYPTDNCFVRFGVGSSLTPEEAFPTYLTHNSGVNMVSQYLESSRLAQEAGKPFYMFETNTASCGGFPGVSDSFGAALWALDYGMQMAYGNFSGGLLHVGGQDTYYNAFTPPPTNVSLFRQWTVGPVYYSTLIMAEALGSTGGAQVYDLQANGGNEFTPGYVIFENGQPVRVLLLNYMTDPTGGVAYTASLSIAGATLPANVRAKHFTADTVSQKGNFTWAGQTFGGIFASDGRLQGEEVIETITCDQAANACPVRVPAPGAVLVFLTEDALEASQPEIQTFSTTAVTRLSNTATIDAAVLATSNGHGGMDRQRLGSTSRGSSGASGMQSARALAWVGIGTVACGFLGAFMLM